MSAENNDPRLDTSRGIIAWFARNPVAANLLMFAIILGGFYSASIVRKQMFPMVEINIINVSAVYRGASPQEIEETITLKLEDAFQSIDGLERVITRSNRGSASATLEILEEYDAQEVLDEVKSAVDAISSFPAGMEPPRVQLAKFRQEVMWLFLAGDVSTPELKKLGQTIYDELRALPDVNIVEIYDGPKYEMAIEVQRDKLREYDLRFEQIANAVRGFSTNSSAGEIKADEGYISVRVDDQAYVGADYENIPLHTLADGTVLRVGDVATVSDGLEEGVNFQRLDGQNAITFFVGASVDQSITDVADTLNTYISERQSTLPQGIRLSPWVDFTYYLNGRLNMMMENMLWGGVLVFLILAVFLRIKLAFWVMLGLPVSFLGAMALMPTAFIDVTINVVSLFAFIMVLGVVVDDAIIIGESVYTEFQDYGQNRENVIRGALRVAMPATFGVLTTMAAFVPLALESGAQSAMPNAIGYVVILCLFFSLVESKLILPAHLAEMSVDKPAKKNLLTRLRERVDSKLFYFIREIYQPFLVRALTYRYTVLVSFLSLIIFTGAMFASGHIRMIMFPKIPHDFVVITLEMNPDAPESALLNGMNSLNKMIREVEAEVEAEHGQPMVAMVHMYDEGRSQAKVQAKLVDPEDRPIDTFELTKQWRERLPKIPNMKNITIIDTLMHGGQHDGDLNFRLKSQNEAQLKAAASELKDELNTLKGVSEVNDSEQPSAQEIQFTLKPVAYSLGLTTHDVARQAGYSLYGIEAQRIMRDREEIRVMVRYPRAERDSLSAINDVLIRTPQGAEVPLVTVADIEFTEGKNQIYREGGHRAISVWGNVDSKQAESLKIANNLEQDFFPTLQQKYPAVSVEESGKLKNDREGQQTQILGILIIMLPIYVLLALPLKSYLQPLMIMSVIPFGIIGAIWGHILLGLDLSRPSMFGIFAVVGVVVNDSLVMVDYINHARERGERLKEAVLHAGQKRFRAIMLTSLTTFIGLIPIMSETSLQAKIVIPMAVSLAFGVLFATLVTLILVPSLYMMSADMKAGLQKVWRAAIRFFAQTKQA